MPTRRRCSCAICRRWWRSARRRRAPPSSRCPSTSSPPSSVATARTRRARPSRSACRRALASVTELDPYGLRGVLGAGGVLPQQGEALDPGLPLGPDELRIDVELLNVDAASFRQLEAAAQGDPARIAARVREIVRDRGKLHNPVTGSGGMLIGRVAEVGPQHPARSAVRPGDRIATLVSLTLTPLLLEEVRAVHARAERLEVKAQAILFATGPWAKLPDDLPEALALAVLDVCGAPAWVARLARAGQRVLVLGAGKSGPPPGPQAKPPD